MENAHRQGGLSSYISTLSRKSCLVKGNTSHIQTLHLVLDLDFFMSRHIAPEIVDPSPLVTQAGTFKVMPHDP